MEWDKAYDLMDIELLCVRKNAVGACDRKCSRCDLVQRDSDLIEAYQMSKFALKRMKGTREAEEKIYPLTVMRDRYDGTYSGGKFTAWNLDYPDIPIQAISDDNTASGFFKGCSVIYGVGDTVDEAIYDLGKKILKRG